MEFPSVLPSWVIDYNSMHSLALCTDTRYRIDAKSSQIYHELKIGVGLNCTAQCNKQPGKTHIFLSFFFSSFFEYVLYPS